MNGRVAKAIRRGVFGKGRPMDKSRVVLGERKIIHRKKTLTGEIIDKFVGMFQQAGTNPLRRIYRQAKRFYYKTGMLPRERNTDWAEKARQPVTPEMMAAEVPDAMMQQGKVEIFRILYERLPTEEGDGLKRKHYEYFLQKLPTLKDEEHPMFSKEALVAVATKAMKEAKE